MPESPGTVYQLCFAGRDLDQLQVWAERAKRLGIGQSYLEVLKTIQQKLTTEPLDWGEPQYRLREMGLLLLHKIHVFFYISYAVDEERRLVYVRDCRVLPNNPLAQND